MGPHLAIAVGAINYGWEGKKQVRRALAAPRARVFFLWYWSAWHLLSSPSILPWGRDTCPSVSSVGPASV